MSAEVITVESRSNIIDASHVIRNYSLLVIIGLMILIGSGSSISSFGGFPYIQ
jgi:predicted histidine transporter YuiF (NhaC family)